MRVDRRKFVTLAAASLASPAVLAASRPIKAIAFDGFPITDPRPVFAKVEELFPTHGRALSEAWRTRLFEYTWLRSLGWALCRLLACDRTVADLCRQGIRR
jgi:2-haloacid dehalogenase